MTGPLGHGQWVVVFNRLRARLARSAVPDRRIVTWLVAATVAVNGLTAAVVATAAPGLLHRPAGSHPRAVAKPAATPAAAAAVRTPADAALDAVVGDPAALFPDGFTPSDVVTAVSGVRFDRACPGDAQTTAAVSRTRQARSGGTGVTVTVEAFGAGQGALALSELHDRLTHCAGRDDVKPVVATIGSPAGAFTATTAGQALAAYHRGDVVVIASAGRTDGRSATADALTVARNADTLLTAALTNVCAQVDSSVADAARSPYGRLPYQPYTRPVVVTGAAVPSPALPDPAQVPALVLPSPRPFPELAPPLPDPPGGLGPAPVLVDPAQIPAPDPVVTTAPTKPTDPGPAPTQATAAVPDADTTGPGCGWAFTGQQPPHVDTAALQAADDAALQAAQQHLTDEVAAWQAKEAAYQAAWRAYDTDRAAYEAYLQYKQAVAGAQAQLDAARQAAHPPTPVPRPSPTPAPAPTPGPSPSTSADSSTVTSR